MRKIFISFVFSCIFFVELLFAQPKYDIQTAGSKIEGKITYSLIGQYQAQFTDFSGEVIFDPKDLEHSSVLLRINAKSIKSKFPALDRVVRSARLLDTRKYPWIVFKSQSIKQDKNQYYVTGTIDIHGIQRPVAFPFTVESKSSLINPPELKARGKFEVNRKEFDIIWHKVLDKGGIIVGNDITVEWVVQAKS